MCDKGCETVGVITMRLLLADVLDLGKECRGIQCCFMITWVGYEGVTDGV